MDDEPNEEFQPMVELLEDNPQWKEAVHLWIAHSFCSSPTYSKIPPALPQGSPTV